LVFFGGKKILIFPPPPVEHPQDAIVGL